MEMRRGGKEVGFQGGTYSLKTIYIHMFLLDIYKKIFFETNLDFSSNFSHTLKDLDLFKVLWTTYQHF